MGSFFLAPWLLAGASLLSLPWLIHQIRRPERLRVPFGSLMFVPNVKKQVIERRSIQHILLMLLRMLILLILALAFARPYMTFLAESAMAGAGGLHVIVIDNSLSMGKGGAFDAARARAEAILNDLGSSERAGLVWVCPDRLPRQPVTLEGESVQENRRRIRLALQGSQSGYSRGVYEPALRQAQEMLLSSVNDSGAESGPKLTVHFISDFQKTGMPPADDDWKLSSRLELDLVRVESNDALNLTLSDAVLRKEPAGRFRVLAQVRNDSPVETSGELALYMDGAQTETQPVAVPPGDSMKASFTVDIDPARPHQARLELSQDALDADNRRFVVWNPVRQRLMRLVSESGADRVRWPGSWFIEKAAEGAGDLKVERIDAVNLTGGLENESPGVTCISSLNALTADNAAALTAYLDRGGKLLACLDPNAPLSQPVRDWLAGMECTPGEPRYSETRADRFGRFDWIDFNHPIFAPLSGARFNDFSSIHVNNYYLVNPDGGSDAVRVFARFEGGPAMLEMKRGAGAMILWTFTPDLSVTNLPRGPKFVSILLETLNALAGPEPEARESWVGEPIEWPAMVPAGGEWTVELPGAPEPAEFSPAAFRADPPSAGRPGVMTWTSASQSGESVRFAVNPHPDELRFASVPDAEFLLQLGSGELIKKYNRRELSAAIREGGADTVRVEYGWWMVPLFVLALAAESIYAAWVSRLERRKRLAEEGS
ncbi:MAG: VWA domain-containing protein [bacterium]|nr:VWA domain-containing protein [bacterium]